LAAGRWLGVRGKNAHVILEVADKSEAVSSQSAPVHALLLSAKTGAAVEELAAAYAAIAKSPGELEFADVCFSAAVTREHFSHRLAIVAADWADLCAKLDAFRARRRDSGIFQGAGEFGVAPGAQPARRPRNGRVEVWRDFVEEQARSFGAGAALRESVAPGRRVRLPKYPW